MVRWEISRTTRHCNILRDDDYTTVSFVLVRSWLNSVVKVRGARGAQPRLLPFEPPAIV